MIKITNANNRTMDDLLDEQDLEKSGKKMQRNSFNWSVHGLLLNAYSWLGSELP